MSVQANDGLDAFFTDAAQLSGNVILKHAGRFFRRNFSIDTAGIGRRVIFLACNLQAAVGAVDRRKGEPIWKKPLGGGNVKLQKQNMSTPSPVTDGTTVWVMTGTGMLKAFDFKGTELWSRDIQQEYGRFGLNHGYASSPLSRRATPLARCSGAVRPAVDASPRRERVNRPRTLGVIGALGLTVSAASLSVVGMTHAHRPPGGGSGAAGQAHHHHHHGHHEHPPVPAEYARADLPVHVWTDAAMIARGKEIFSAKCAVCHGETGNGKGPGAARLALAIAYWGGKLSGLLFLDGFVRT